MATRRHPKQRPSAKARHQRSSRDGRPPKARPHLARSVASVLVPKGRMSAAHHDIGNPLAISHPAGFLPPAQARRIIILKRQQHLLWSWAVALAILLVFIISIPELLSTFGLIPALPSRTADLLEGADMLALLVIGLELYGHYRATRNKALFLRQNWLAILALLPLGIFLRAFRAFESLGALRTFQLAGKIDELSVALPGLNLAALESIPVMFSRLTLQLHNIATHLGGVTEFLELAAESIGRLFR